jgi:predicted RNA-binding Zn-ribbon protein involved in translation (DUF1610 family)
MEERVDRAKDDPVCRKCGRTVQAAELMTGMSFLEGRIYSCPKCGPSFGSASPPGK